MGNRLQDQNDELRGANHRAAHIRGAHRHRREEVRVGRCLISVSDVLEKFLASFMAEFSAVIIFKFVSSAKFVLLAVRRWALGPAG